MRWEGSPRGQCVSYYSQQKQANKNGGSQSWWNRGSTRERAMKKSLPAQLVSFKQGNLGLELIFFQTAVSPASNPACVYLGLHPSFWSSGCQPFRPHRQPVVLEESKNPTCPYQLPRTFVRSNGSGVGLTNGSPINQSGGR